MDLWSLGELRLWQKVCASADFVTNPRCWGTCMKLQLYRKSIEEIRFSCFSTETTFKIKFYDVVLVLHVTRSGLEDGIRTWHESKDRRHSTLYLAGFLIVVLTIIKRDNNKVAEDDATARSKSLRYDHCPWSGLLPALSFLERMHVWPNLKIHRAREIESISSLAALYNPSLSVYCCLLSTSAGSLDPVHQLDEALHGRHLRGGAEGPTSIGFWCRWTVNWASDAAAAWSERLKGDASASSSAGSTAGRRSYLHPGLWNFQLVKCLLDFGPRRSQATNAPFRHLSSFWKECGVHSISRETEGEAWWRLVD